MPKPTTPSRVSPLGWAFTGLVGVGAANQARRLFDPQVRQSGQEAMAEEMSNALVNTFTGSEDGAAAARQVVTDAGSQLLTAGMDGAQQGAREGFRDLVRSPSENIGSTLLTGTALAAVPALTYLLYKQYQKRQSRNTPQQKQAKNRYGPLLPALGWTNAALLGSNVANAAAAGFENAGELQRAMENPDGSQLADSIATNVSNRIKDAVPLTPASQARAGYNFGQGMLTSPGFWGTVGVTAAAPYLLAKLITWQRQQRRRKEKTAQEAPFDYPTEVPWGTVGALSVPVGAYFGHKALPRRYRSPVANVGLTLGLGSTAAISATGLAVPELPARITSRIGATTAQTFASDILDKGVRQNIADRIQSTVDESMPRMTKNIWQRTYDASRALPDAIRTSFEKHPIRTGLVAGAGVTALGLLTALLVEKLKDDTDTALNRTSPEPVA